MVADDPLNKKAVDDHAKTYRKRRKTRVHARAEAGSAYCAMANWLRARRDHDGDACLFVPGAHPGFPATVRFNFRQVAASRAMCILAHGTPPAPKLMAIHSCGNGKLSCVNPKHLRWGTAKDNARDAVLHGTLGNMKASIDDFADDPTKLAKVVAVEKDIPVAAIKKARGT